MTDEPPRKRSDAGFFLVLGGLSSCFLSLVVLMLLADFRFISSSDFIETLSKPEIRSAFRVTLLTCTISAILAVWTAAPLAYLLSRFRFWGRGLIEALVDTPMVLPPLVIGLSLLILFHQPLPAALSESGQSLEQGIRSAFGFGVTYRWPAIVLAQFMVAAAFAIRTMRVTFDQIDPRAEDIARVLGCTRLQAFLRVSLPQASRGLIAAIAIAWARSLGEFGPILVFAGATRMRTEVLSTSVFLELSVGELDAAVAVSLLMVAMAASVLLSLRLIGARLG
ncbi:MAG: ABC transporter permease [Planctomycetota bacterium]